MTFVRTLLGQPGYDVSTPTQLTANVNDYGPSTLGIWRLSSDASRNITGIVAAAVDGQLLLLLNVGAQNIVLTNQDALSVAANRILTGTGANVTLAADDTALLVYDLTTARWRITNTY